MKRNNFYMMMIMAAMMCMASVNVNAQGRRGGDFRGGRDGYSRGGHNREMVMHHDGRMEMRGGRQGRIRYERGRWGYLRGHDWYWYDTYYEPDFYYGHPVGHFHHCHVSPAAAVAGAVGAVALSALVAALSY